MALADLSPDAAWKLGFVAIIAEISLIGAVSAIWGLFRVRRTRFRPGAFHRLVDGLLAWRIIEEDPTGEYRQAESLVIMWTHRQGLTAILCGLGIVAAGVLTASAALLIPTTSGSANTGSALHIVPQQFVLLFLVYLHLLVVGTIGGTVLGYIRAFRRSGGDPHVAPRQPQLGVGAYRASWLPWLVMAAVMLDAAVFALWVPSALWHSRAAQLVALFALPGIAIGEIVVLEGVVGALCRMPFTQLPSTSGVADQQHTHLRALLVTVIFCSQVATLPLLATSQLLAFAWIAISASTAVAVPSSLGYAYLFLQALGGMLLIGLLSKTGGRLGGSSTG